MRGRALPTAAPRAGSRPPPKRSTAPCWTIWCSPGATAQASASSDCCNNSFLAPLLLERAPTSIGETAMAVVAAYLYKNGARVRGVGIDERCDHSQDKSDFVWIGVTNPTPEEMKALQACYDLHPLAVEDSIKAEQLPKVEVYGDQLFVVARTARLDGETIEYGETAIFVGHNHIITVRHGSERAHTRLREKLEKAPRLLMHGTDYVLHAVLDYIVDGYAPLVDDIEEEVLEMEGRAADSFLQREQVS